MRIQVSGLPAVGSHTYQLEVVDHYGECCSVGPAQTIITVGPKPLAAINSLQVEAIKAATGKKAKKETVLVLQFSGALNAAAADNAGAYGLAPVIKVRASGKGKNRKPATIKLGSPLALASAIYNGSNKQVTLAPRTKLTASKPEELIVNGTLITDTLGRELDGADDGQAGRACIATISGTRVTAGGVPSLRTEDGGRRTED